jgi:hypothetical protein
MAELSKPSSKPILLITNYNIIEKHSEEFEKFTFKFTVLD